MTVRSPSSRTTYPTHHVLISESHYVLVFNCIYFFVLQRRTLHVSCERLAHRLREGEFYHRFYYVNVDRDLDILLVTFVIKFSWNMIQIIHVYNRKFILNIEAD